MIIDRFTGQAIEDLKRDRAAMVSVLEEAGAKIRGQAVICPLCDDKHPSAGIYQPNGEGFKYKCHQCNFQGDILDIIAKLDGISSAEACSRLRGKPQQQKIYPTIEALGAAMPYPVTDTYKYTHPSTGSIELVIFRLFVSPDGKSFRQASPVSGGFVMQASEKPWPLYNRKRSQTADTVVVVEGEGKCHALHRFGIVATTSPGGALKAQHADWTSLAGKSVVLWPDADDKGKAHMEQVEKILQGLEPACRVSMLDPAVLDLKGKEDCVDFIEHLESRHTEKLQVRASLQKAIETAEPSKSISDAVMGEFEDIWSGKTQVIPWPWPVLSDATQALCNGVVTLIVGAGGASKSLMLVQALRYWHDKKIKVAVLELEHGRIFHIKRAVAQAAGDSRVSSIQKSGESPDEIRAILDKYKDFQNSFGKAIWEFPFKQTLNLNKVIDWIEARAKAGYRIIAVDPVSIMPKGNEIWKEDREFLLRVHDIARQYRCSLVLVSHPTKSGNSMPAFESIAGGADWSRQTKCVLWLERHEPKESMITMACGSVREEHNRTVHVLKASDSWGAGLRIGFNFDKQSLTLKEEGVIRKKKR